MLHLPSLLLLPVLCHSFKFHTHALLSSHSLCLCKKTPAIHDDVTPFNFTKSRILLFLPPSFHGSHISLLLLPGYIPYTIFPFLAAYDPSPLSPIIFLLSALQAAVLFSLVLWFQLRALLLLLYPMSIFVDPSNPFAEESDISLLCSTGILPSAHPIPKLTLLHWFSSAIFYIFDAVFLLLNSDCVSFSFILHVFFFLMLCHSVFPQFPGHWYLSVFASPLVFPHFFFPFSFYLNDLFVFYLLCFWHFSQRAVFPLCKFVLTILSSSSFLVK